MKSVHSIILVMACAAARGDGAALAAENQFMFEQAGHHLLVRYLVPDQATPTTPVVFVLHGVKRDADLSFRVWTPLARERAFILVVPEFNQEEFPGEQYIYGNTFDEAGRLRPRPLWAFAMIESIFDDVRRRTGNQTVHYDIFGHSGGAQFVERMLLFLPEARVSRAVMANAGFYTLLDFSAAFPYGLKGTPVTEEDVRRFLARPFVVLLGTADIDPKARALRHSPEADTQGNFRYARGEYFFRHLRAAAHARNLPCGWRLESAPGIGHSDEGMAPFGVQQLFFPKTQQETSP